MKRKFAQKRSGRKRSVFILLVLVLPLLTFWIYKQNTTFGVTYYEVTSDKLPEAFHSYRIIQISDLHDAEYGEKHSDLVDKVNMLSPDIIVITGDFIDSNRFDLTKSLNLIKEIQFVAPIYYVTGNHEIATTRAETIKNSLSDLGVIVLTDEAKIITDASGSKIAVGGIEDPLDSTAEDGVAIKESLEQAFENIPQDMYKILLSHRPEHFQLYADEMIDLTFSGHAHGGQFRIPGIGGLVSPGQGWFPKYTSGIHENMSMRMIVSRGLGNSIIPVRIMNQPELVVVTLQKHK